MILKALRLLKSLSTYHCLAIIFTILLPSGLSLVVPNSNLGLIPRAIISGAGFLVWSLVVFLVMALMLDRDRTKADRQLDGQVEILERSVASTATELKSLREHLLDEINNLEETVRLTLKNQIGIDLPPRIKSGRASAIEFHLTIPPATGTTTGGSRMRRIRQRYVHPTYRGELSVGRGFAEGEVNVLIRQAHVCLCTILNLACEMDSITREWPSAPYAEE